MRTSVIIAGHNEGSGLWRTIESCLDAGHEADYELVIVDDGRGLDVAAPGGDYPSVPRVIRERTLAIGGQLTVDSSPGGGVRLEVDFQRAYSWIPISKQSAF